MIFNDRRKARKAGAAERAEVHKIASQDINPYVSRKEKYASAARVVSPETKVSEVMKQYKSSQLGKK